MAPSEPHTAGSASQRAWWLVLVILTLTVEGFDLQTANLAAPSILQQFGISRSQLGPLLSASLFGILVGATLVAPLGDRRGRKRIVVIASMAYGCLSLAAAAAGSVWQLTALRFLIGIGLGAVMPNSLAMAGALYDARRHASVTALAGIGITLGSAVAGVTAARLLPVYHWQGLFIAGGVLPLAIAAIVAVALPDAGAEGGAMAAEARLGRLSVVLARPIRTTTILTWLMFVCVALNVHLLASWIPLLMKGAGLSIAGAAWVTTGFHAGGLAGGIVASLLLRRAGWQAVAIFAGCAAATMLILALTPASAGATIALIACAGFFVTGLQNGINGAASDLYPAASRATGLGWALGVARIGAILGPWVGTLAALGGADRDKLFFLIPAGPLLLVLVLATMVARRAGGRSGSQAFSRPGRGAQG